jgi:hypothetical protein
VDANLSDKHCVSTIGADMLMLEMAVNKEGGVEGREG